MTALQTGPQDPSQLQALINQLTTALNGYATGATPVSLPVVAGTTTANLPASGVVTLSTTSTTSTYKLSSPTIGQLVTLFCKKSTTAGSAGHVVTMASTLVTLSTTFKKIVMKTKNMAITLVGLSSTSWGVVSNVGTVITT